MILGVGLGQLSRLSDVAPTGVSVWTLQVGQRLRPGIHLVEQAEVLRPEAGLDEHGAFSVGIRWSPFEPRPRWSPQNVLIPGRQNDWIAFYVKANVGLGLRDAPDEETAYVPVAALALGYQPIQGLDWAYGFEVREQIARYEEGFQRAFSVLVIFQLSD